MIVIRNSFIAKPGQASKLAGVFKELAAAVPVAGARVLTDMTGDFNHVVFEFELASLTELEARLQEYATNPVFREKMQGYTELWLTGKREILRVVE